MDAHEVAIIITGAHKAIALSKCIEEGTVIVFVIAVIFIITLNRIDI